ncbi:hypothetical protein PAXRUDRAFT_832298 [Paxillus rubicundulus Ve08.2h10]|uniref:Uncharacterized protein n=1 Tax=Paxillus rubicundulus Ve08.2h10 TaxID=930991 RepID=A0A0D0DKN0_9AGAM|nr:hypothetical protein PAXRUDRAFT_832298 [Paxillus rubicundulus Ve08.2h10]
MFECLQVTVQQAGSWSQQDVINNLKGGDYLPPRRPSRIAKVERELKRKRTYKQGAFHANNFNIATQLYETEFKEVFQQAPARSSARDNNELIVFLGVVRRHALAASSRHEVTLHRRLQVVRARTTQHTRTCGLAGRLLRISACCALLREIPRLFSV